MKIIRSRKFQINLLITLQHIATDKVSASINFQKELDKLIKNIPNFPYKYRQSTYFNDKIARDLVYKKHTINYEVNLENNTEEQHYKIEAPDPIEAIKFRMEQEGLKQKDLVAIVGSKSRVSEILNKK